MTKKKIIWLTSEKSGAGHNKGIGGALGRGGEIKEETGGGKGVEKRGWVWECDQKGGEKKPLCADR